ncbi:hypothetical protein BC629DRAFT_1530031, partial [Irpex lacteus]
MHRRLCRQWRRRRQRPCRGSDISRLTSGRRNWMASRRDRTRLLVNTGFLLLFLLYFFWVVRMSSIWSAVKLFLFFFGLFSKCSLSSSALNRAIVFGLHVLRSCCPLNHRLWSRWLLGYSREGARR